MNEIWMSHLKGLYLIGQLSSVFTDGLALVCYTFLLQFLNAIWFIYPREEGWHLVLCGHVLHFYSHDGGDSRKHASIWVSKGKYISERNKKWSPVFTIFISRKPQNLLGI